MKKETRKRLFFRNGKLRMENEIWLSFYHHVHSPFSIFNYPRIFCSVYLSEQLCYTIY